MRCLPAMRLTVRHVFDFGEHRQLVGEDLVRPDAWDALRLASSGPFAVAANRAELERDARSRPDLEARARALDEWLDADGVRRLVSYGVGAALLELWLTQLSPERDLTITEYAPKTVERLAELFPETTVVQHDLVADRPFDTDLHVFHRIDTEFTNRQWRSLLRRYANERVLVIASEVIDTRRAFDETIKRIRGRGRISRAGWVRTRGAFEALWKPTHEARSFRIADLEAWELTPRPRTAS